MGEPKTLREALDRIQGMLACQPYSADLWDVLVALRGPDSRNHSLKMATTAVIRDAAFPKHPTTSRSFYGKDLPKHAIRRGRMFAKNANLPHFREHVKDAFLALGLDLNEVN